MNELKKQKMNQLQSMEPACSVGLVNHWLDYPPSGVDEPSKRSTMTDE